MNAVVVPGNPVPVVVDPGAPESVLGALPGGATVDVLDVVTAGAGRWGKLALNASGQPLLHYGSAQLLYGYVAAGNFVGALQPDLTGTAALGLAVIVSEAAALRAAQMGCRFFSIVGNPDMATRLKDACPDATVLVRPHIDVRGALPGVDYVLSRLGGAKDPRLIYTGLNEADQIGESAAAIPARAEFDRELAERIRSISGAAYAAGSFSTGAPDVTSADVCAAVQQCYAPSFNGGLFWFDQHLYSPDMAHIHREDTQTPAWQGQPQTVVEYEWYEARWRFYYRRCGFDPNGPGRIVCSEAGLDQGSVGGFAAYGATDQDLVNWCRRFMRVSTLPIQVDGTEYPSTFVGAAIFQVGDPVHWAGYDMTRYEGALAGQVWPPPRAAVDSPTQQETS